MKICYYIIFAFFFLQKSSAQTESCCGMCGDSISYSFSNSVLTLEGHGKMYNYVSKPTPWFSIKDSVKKLVVKDGITELGNIAESPFTNLKEVELGKTLVYIGEHWFAECDSLESIVIPENVQSVGWGLFFMCRNLKNVDWKCKASFEGQTFADTSLRNFYVPEGVKFLGLQCFGWCKNLEYLEIPSSVDSISSEIIHGCFNLKSLVIRRKTPPQIREFAFHRGRSLSGDHFEPIYLQGVRLLVPKESVELYKREWGKYVEDVFAIEDEEYCDSKIVENEQIVNSSESSFTVKKVKKLKNDVYVIYANRNDSIFKIVSYYDKKNKRGKKLTKGMRFEVSLQSVFGDFEREYKIIQPCNLSMEFHGVAVGKELENGIDDVWFCEELNGPYLTRELQNTTRCEVRKVNTYKKIVEYEVTLPKGTKKNIYIPRGYEQVACLQEDNQIKIKFFKNESDSEKKNYRIELNYDLELDDTDFYRTSSASYCRPITNIKRIESYETSSKIKAEYYWINRVKAFVPSDNIVIVGSDKKTTTYRILIPKRTLEDGEFSCKYVTIPNDYSNVMIIDESIYIFLKKKKGVVMNRDFDKYDEIRIQYGF